MQLRTSQQHRSDMSNIRILPCLYSYELAETRRSELALKPELAESLGRSAVEAIELGYYLTDQGKVDWSEAVRAACKSKLSIVPETELPTRKTSLFAEAIVQVTNETTLGASRRLVDRGKRPLALNFANGTETGGGFLRGATAQEETLCRSSALFATLVDDPMYDFHRQHEVWAASSDYSAGPSLSGRCARPTAAHPSSLRCQATRWRRWSPSTLLRATP